MQYPRFTVITVCYNDKQGLERTICSIINQTYTDYEYIIIDGGSTDGTTDLIKQYNEHVTFWISEPDNGVYDAMNKAIDYATGEHCIFMNAGDCFFDNQVLFQVAQYGNQYDLGVGISSNTSHETKSQKVYPPKNLSSLFWENYSVIHQAAFMRTSMLKERKYDTNYRIVADWKYMFTEYLSRTYTYQPMNVCVCIFEGGGISSDTAKRISERDRALRELLPPMLYEDMVKRSKLRTLSIDKELYECLTHILESRTLTLILKKTMKLLCMIK